MGSTAIVQMLRWCWGPWISRLRTMDKSPWNMLQEYMHYWSMGTIWFQIWHPLSNSNQPWKRPLSHMVLWQAGQFTRKYLKIHHTPSLTKFRYLSIKTEYTYSMLMYNLPNLKFREMQKPLSTTLNFKHHNHFFLFQKGISEAETDRHSSFLDNSTCNMFIKTGSLFPVHCFCIIKFAFLKKINRMKKNYCIPYHSG